MIGIAAGEEKDLRPGEPPVSAPFYKAATVVDDVERFDVGERSVALENAAYIMKALLDPQTPPPPHDTPEEAFEWISDRLEVSFSRRVDALL